jgi:hypothetical protein
MESNNNKQDQGYGSGQRYLDQEGQINAQATQNNSMFGSAQFSNVSGAQAPGFGT